MNCKLFYNYVSREANGIRALSSIQVPLAWCGFCPPSSPLDAGASIWLSHDEANHISHGYVYVLCSSAKSLYISL